VAFLLLAAVAVGLAAQPDWRLGEMVLHDSLSRMPAKFRAEWLLKRGLDASAYTEYHRPESTGLRLVGKYGRGPSNEVTGRGNLIALTLGSEVALLSFANHDSPVVLSEIQLSFIPRQTALHDSFLLTCGNGIEIWNIADSTHPVYRNVIPYGVGDFAIVDTFLYFGSWGTFYAYSIAHAASPYELGRCADSGYVTTATRNVAVLRELDDVMGFIDVSNPAAPHRVGTYPSYALDADARGSICCAAIYWSTDEDHFRFDVLDISDPTNVTRIGSIDSAGGWDIQLSGPFAFVSGFQTPKWEFTIVDVQDSAHPHVVSSCATPGDNYGVWADWTSDWAYVADMTGLAVIDIANVNAPALDTCLLQADLAEDVSIDGDRAYVADYRAGLRILDVSVPSAPVELGAMDTATGTSTSTAAGRDSFAYMGWADPPPFLRSVDVSDPNHPVMAGGCAVWDWPQDMVLRDSLLYVAQRVRFQVINVARPRQPVLVGSCVLSGETGDMALVDTLAFLSGPSLTVMNVSRPDNPQIVNTWSHGVWGLDVVDTILYAVGQNAQFWTLNVADPASPRPLDSLHLPSYDGEDVVVVGTTAYVGERTIRVVDVSDPSNLRLCGAVSIPGWADRLLYERPYVYAACFDAGVCIFETTQVGIAEPKQGEGEQARKGVSVVRGVLFLPEATSRKPEAASWLLDVSGRKVLDLHPGANDVRALAPGVYFVREEPQGLAIRKVILTR
jgi:hypothetical protein